MGAACCVAARDKTVRSGSSGEILHRNIRYSPTWSFRWDHRGRIAGEDASISWVSDGLSQNDGSESKNESAYVSEDGSPFQSYQRHRCQKSPISAGATRPVRTSTSDQSISRNVSMDVSFEQVKGSAESSCPSPAKLSLSLPLTLFAASPVSSQNHQLSQHVSDSQMPVFKSPSSFSVSEERPVFSSWSNESARRSCGGSSDGWSVPGFSELMGTSPRARQSFEIESFSYNREKLARSNSQHLGTINLQICGVCSKLLTEKSSWSTQKIIASNDLSVVAVLVCGHVYHAECLESITPEINKYDPACPVCTYGEKQTIKMSEKALKAEMDLRARNKKSKNQVLDGDLDDDSIVFDHFKGKGHHRKGLEMDSISSGRSSFRKPFLKRHFSFGSKGSKAMLDNHSTRKRGFFWAKSSKE